MPSSIAVCGISTDIGSVASAGWICVSYSHVMPDKQTSTTRPLDFPVLCYINSAGRTETNLHFLEQSFQILILIFSENLGKLMKMSPPNQITHLAYQALL